MHATIEQLLAVRDREPADAAIKEHVGVCLLCRETLAELVLAKDELNRLPVQAPPRDFWLDIQAQAEQRKQSVNSTQKLLRYGALGLAASVLLAAVVFIDQGDVKTTVPIPAGTSESVIDDNTTGINNTVADNDTDRTKTTLSDTTGTGSGLDTLISRSAQLEAVLHALPQRPGIVRASTADLITGLQDGVALIDYQLNLNADKLSPDQSRQLWQQRVDFMNSLVNVRYAESQRVAYSPN